MLLTYGYVVASTIVETASKGIPETKAIFKSIAEEKAELLNELKKEKNALEPQKAGMIKGIETDIEENKNKRAAVEKELEKDPDDEFLVRKLSLLTETYDVLRDIQRIWEGLIKKISDHVALLEKYLNDPELKEYTKEVKISSGPYFFEDLEDAHQKMMSQQRFVEQLKRRKEAVLKEQKNSIQVLEKATEDYKEKKAKLEDFNKSPTETKTNHVPFGLSTQQRAELLNLENNLFKLKMDVAQLQLKEKRHEVSIGDNEFFVESLHLDILQDIAQKIKASITVTAEQIDTSHQELEKKKQTFSALKAKYNDEINKLRKIREDESNKLSSLSMQYGIQLGNELNTWSLEPKKTVESYKGLAQVGTLNAYVQLLDEREAYFVSLISLEQEKINYAEEVAKVKETYYKILSRKFVSEDEIGQEIKKYTARQTANDVLLKSYKTKKEEIEAALVKLQNEVLEQLKKRRTDVEQQREMVFKGRINDYVNVLTLIDKAIEYILFRTDVVGSTGKATAEIIGILDKVSGHTKFILAELESITIWYRPEYAITWAGILSIPSDIKMFFIDLRTYIGQFDIGNLTLKASDIFKKPLQVLLLLILSLVVIGGLLFVRRYAHFALTVLRTIADQMPKLRWFVLSIAMGISFIGQHAISIGIWLTTLIFVKQYMAADPYLFILFYLISIPYLVYLAHQGISFVFSFNASNKYFLISQDSQPRFLALFYLILHDHSLYVV